MLGTGLSPAAVWSMSCRRQTRLLFTEHRQNGCIFGDGKVACGARPRAGAGPVYELLAIRRNGGQGDCCSIGEFCRAIPPQLRARSFPLGVATTVPRVESPTERVN